MLLPIIVYHKILKSQEKTNIEELKVAINKKQSESEFLTDLQQIHQVYAQSVYQNHFAKRSTTHYGVSRPVGDAIQNASSNNSIPQNSEKSTGNSQKGESEIIPELWQKYADAVLDILAKEDGKMVDELIREQQNEHEQAELERLKRVYYNAVSKKTAELKAAGKSDSEIERAINEYLKPKIMQLDEARAIKEIVADASQLILTRSSNFAEKLKAKDEGLFEKIIELAKKAIEKIREVLSGLATPNDGVSAAVEKHLDELTEYFDEMLADTLYKAGFVENQSLHTSPDNIQYQERRFDEQVELISENKFPRGNLVYVCKTPKILQDIGLNGNLPMLTTATHIKKSIEEKDFDDHTHGLTKEQIKLLPEKISHPVMLLDSLNDSSNSVVAVTDMLDSEGSPIIAIIKADSDARYNNVEIKSNFLLPYYGKDGFSNFIERNIQKDSFLYINKERSRALSNKTKVQFFGKLNRYDFDIIIRKTNAVVKPFFENSPNSQNSQNQNRRMVGETDRAVLSKALLDEGVGSEADFKLLKEYRADLAAYKEMEREIATLTAEIKRLKDSTEPEQHKDNKLEAAYARRKELKDRLDEIDAKLLNIEAMSPIRKLVTEARAKAKSAETKLSHIRESYDRSLKKRQKEWSDKQLERERKRQERNMRATYLARAERALSRIYRRLANPTKNEPLKK